MGTTFSGPFSDDAIDGSPAGSEDAEKERKEAAREELDIDLPTEFTAKYEVLSKIGTGGFGKVYKVRDIRTKAVYAAKHLDDHESNRKEVHIQAQLDDPHVVKIFDTIHTRSRVPNTPGQLFIIMEFCDGGNLMEWIKRNRKHQMLNETVILQMLQEICQAVYNCQQKRIIHRDLKPENVLLDSKRRIKLADFGVARMLDRASVAKSFCGTPPYMAPELFLSYLSGTGSPGQNAVGYDGKCDVWSIGCILWDMANSKNTFVYEFGGGNQYLGYSVAQASTDSRGEREISQLVEDDIPQEYKLTKRLLHQMLKRNAQERASLSEVLQDAELRKVLENPLGGHWSDIYDKI